MSDFNHLVKNHFKIYEPVRIMNDEEKESNLFVKISNSYTTDLSKARGSVDDVAGMKKYWKPVHWM